MSCINPYVNKKLVACSDTEAACNNHKTQHVYVTVHRCVWSHTKLYKQFVNHSQSHLNGLLQSSTRCSLTSKLANRHFIPSSYICLHRAPVCNA